MKKAVIGITVGELYNQAMPWGPLVYGQSQTYVNAVLGAGGVPILLPIVEDEKILRVQYEQCDGILLSGGNDVDPALYGEEQKAYTKDVSRRRDNQEIQLVHWARQDDRPILAICRGAQLLNVALGGSLYQDIKEEIPGAHNHSASHEHKDFTYIAHDKLVLKPGSKLREILGVDEIRTNALHHQSIKSLGKELHIAAWTEDDVIEAVELPEAKFVIGVQSHPESLEAQVEPHWQKLFRAFVSSCV